MMDKAILKAAVAELRKELRAHGGKSLMPGSGPATVTIEVEAPGDEEGDEEEATGEEAAALSKGR